MKLLTKRREPLQFMLWCAILGMTLTFLFLTLMYVLRKSVGTAPWESFVLPKVFGISTFFIVFSSYTLHEANKAFGKEDFFTFRYLLGATLFFGVLFIFTQWLGWGQMQAKGFPLVKGQVSGGFIYVISGLHVLHLVGGMVALLWVFFQVIRRTNYVDAFVYAVNPPNQLRLRLVSIYWHFVDILWIYLYLFFSYHHR